MTRNLSICQKNQVDTDNLFNYLMIFRYGKDIAFLFIVRISLSEYSEKNVKGGMT